MAQRCLIVIGLLVSILTGFNVQAEPLDSELKLPSVYQLQTRAAQADEAAAAKAAKEDREVRDLFAEDERLELLVDYHPTVDRWTERNNRIRLTSYVSLWLFSGELDIDPTGAFGLRASWEVPGFIAVHFDTAIAPLAKLEVKPGGSGNPQSSRHADGYVGNFYLSVAIFNPELSTENLAFWAGVGAGIWYQVFDESNVQNSFIPTDVDFDEVVPAVKVFIEIDYKVTPVVHVGFGFAGHFLYAEYTDDGRFYDVNGVEGGVATGGRLTQDGRNDGFIGHLSFVADIHLSLSIVF